ncbi:MAG TPA: DNA-processing protein DprA [Chlamydiales bacterium]|nr:DNA-processing protein DprA [Chlamydiales bacterium]
MSGYPVLSIFEEISAYEALWDHPNASFRTLATQLSDFPYHLASSFVDPLTIDAYKKTLLPIFKSLSKFGARIDGDGMFPIRLKDARHPLKIFYFQGNWELSYLPSVAIVGTRNPTSEGIERTRYLAKRLVSDKFAIVSGLAKGIDTAAHQAAIENNGNTIAVIGTPLNRCYPSENLNLQNTIARDFLLVSQVPFSKYSKQDFRKNRFFFPERNITMSALSQATIIVEAGETSGTLVQAKAALEQGRKLIILENNFLQPSLTWPKKLQEQGAIRVKDYEQIRELLSPSSSAY